MKTKLLILLLVPFLTFAKYYKATVTFSDGKSMTGFAETPKMKDSKINFKVTEKEINKNLKQTYLNQLFSHLIIM